MEDAALLGAPGIPRQPPARRPKLDAWVGVIDQILKDDKAEGRKQRHTAKRIFERLRSGPTTRILSEALPRLWRTSAMRTRSRIRAWQN